MSGEKCLYRMKNIIFHIVDTTAATNLPFVAITGAYPLINKLYLCSKY